MMRTNVVTNDLPAYQQLDCFKRFTEDEFKILARGLRYKKIKAGQVIFEEGEDKDKYYVLLDGLVRIERYDESATYYYYDYIQSNDLFPFEGLLSDEEHPFSAEAITDIEVLTFPAKSFEELCLTNPAQMRFIARRLTSIIRYNETRMQYELTQNAQDRVRQHLYFLRNTLGKTVGTKTIIPYPVTLKEISLNSGTSAETTRQVIRSMVEDGEIEYSHKRFTFY
ncbi:MAG: Crp/Fnr family transcriptional regulator [Lactobacillales bacterium]|nr:Crp/Fnr family transcriptional regulator [Lactobacillales bacterium]